MNDDQQFDESEPHSYLRSLRSPLRLRLRWRLVDLLGRLSRNGRSYMMGEDTTCTVHCLCGEEVWASEGRISWCKKCGRGFQTSFTLRNYSRRLRPRPADIQAMIEERERNKALLIQEYANRPAPDYLRKVNIALGLPPDYPRSLGDHPGLHHANEELEKVREALQARLEGKW